ncbi:hypothetical protein [Methanosarcina sp.]|uniref:hypothetical protein n=1 Tax=Methanosarcina sp. TaxID=2213 RepID=UPI003C715336
MNTVSLAQVFGIGCDLPKYTYVDRSHLDEKFKYLLSTQKHIVIYGSSKQGKSCLRKKVLSDSQCTIIQCIPSMTCENILQHILEVLNKPVPNVSDEKKINSTKNSLAAKLEAGCSLIGKFLLKGEVEGTDSVERSCSYQYTSGYEKNIQYISKKLFEENKKLVLEDFHYLSELTKEEFAFDLKAFFENHTFVLISGVWEEQNILSYYNGDLLGRVDEINITWTDPELNLVLAKGAEALNITFSNNLTERIIKCSFHNVGLVSRIAEKLCFIENILKTQEECKILSNYNSLNIAITSLIKEMAKRYERIENVFKSRPFNNYTNCCFYQIFRAITEFDNKSLLNGIHRRELHQRIRYFDKTITEEDLKSTLEELEILQSENKISPMLITYNRSMHEIILTDREFLFYREYGDVKWEWSIKSNMDDDLDVGSRVVTRPFLEIEKIGENLMGENIEYRHPLLGTMVVALKDDKLREIVNLLKSSSSVLAIKISKENAFRSKYMDFYIKLLYDRGYAEYETINKDEIEVSLTKKGSTFFIDSYLFDPGSNNKENIHIGSIDFEFENKDLEVVVNKVRYKKVEKQQSNYIWDLEFAVLNKGQRPLWITREIFLKDENKYYDPRGICYYTKTECLATDSYYELLGSGRRKYYYSTGVFDNGEKIDFSDLCGAMIEAYETCEPYIDLEFQKLRSINSINLCMSSMKSSGAYPVEIKNINYLENKEGSKYIIIEIKNKNSESNSLEFVSEIYIQVIEESDDHRLKEPLRLNTNKFLLTPGETKDCRVDLKEKNPQRIKGILLLIYVKEEFEKLA